MALPEHLIQEIDDRIGRLMPTDQRLTHLYGMLRYHLGWLDERLRPTRADTGKRIRARLCLLACSAAGAFPERAIPAATAVELVHNFSLIHDDIQDRSEFRRHRRTVWAVWGDAQAINAGDAMLVLAQSALTDVEPAETEAGVVLRALRILNSTCRRLCEGQFLDLEFERRARIAVEDYYAMIEGKTAALLETACFLGALFAGAGEADLDAYSGFGRHLGLAFQIRDDYLGIWGDTRETGKPSAADVAAKKKTLPLLFAQGGASEADRARLEKILSRPDPPTGDEVAAVLEILDRCGAAEYTASEVERLSEVALQQLDSAHPEVVAGAELSRLCRGLAVRTR